MAVLKYKEIEKFSEDERTKRLKELKMELARSKANAVKSGKSNSKEIKKAIARILTFNSLNKEKLKKK